MSRATELRKFIRLIKTKIWYRLVETNLQANSAYQLEVLFEAKPLKRDADGKLYINGKWAKYRSGSVSPSRPQVTKVNQRVAGTEHLFHHVLWSVLDFTKLKYGDIPIFLNQLSPDVKKVIFKKTRSPVGLEYVRKPLTRLQIRALEQISNLDALTCITILLIEAFFEENEDFFSEIFHTLGRILICVSAREPYSGAKMELNDLYEMSFFQLRI